MSGNDVQLLHLHRQLVQSSRGDATSRKACERMLADARQSHKLFQDFHAGEPAGGSARSSAPAPPVLSGQLCSPAVRAEGLHPFLVAYTCSIFSLIVSASTGLQTEVNEKVSKLPAVELHEEVGTARLALIGITDLHRQLCHNSIRMSGSPTIRTPQPGSSGQLAPAPCCSGTPRACMREEGPYVVGPSRPGRVLEHACAAMVIAADRLLLHAHYMHGFSLYLHRRTVAAVVRPHGPLSEADAAVLEELLRFFKGLPEEMCRGGVDSWDPRNPGASLCQVCGTVWRESACSSLVCGPQAQVCMYVREFDYIAVSTRTLTPPTTGTDRCC